MWAAWASLGIMRRGTEALNKLEALTYFNCVPFKSGHAQCKRKGMKQRHQHFPALYCTCTSSTLHIKGVLNVHVHIINAFRQIVMNY